MTVRTVEPADEIPSEVYIAAIEPIAYVDLSPAEDARIEAVVRAMWRAAGRYWNEPER